MGVKQITPHLVVKGGAEAIEFYKKAFDAVEHMRMPAPEGDKLWHAQLGFGDATVMLADEFPEYGGSLAPSTLGGTGVVVHLNVDNCDATFNQAVAAGATPAMPPVDMFWGDRYAQVVDPFGHRWSIAHPIEALTPEQMKQRAEEAVAAMGNEPCGQGA